MQNASGHQVLGGNLNFGKPGLTAGTTTTYTIATAFVYTILGVNYSKAAASNAASPTTDLNTGAAFRALSANQACLFAFCVNAAGTVSVAQGPIVDNREMGTNGTVGCACPPLPDTVACFGYLLAQADSTLVGTWTFGTNNLSSVTGMTYTFRDTFSAPTQPVTA